MVRLFGRDHPHDENVQRLFVGLAVTSDYMASGLLAYLTTIKSDELQPPLDAQSLAHLCNPPHRPNKRHHRFLVADLHLLLGRARERRKWEMITRKILF